MQRKKCLKLISTDSIGWLGTPNQFFYLYKDYFKNNTFDGVEMIAFKPYSKLNNFINVLKKNNIKTYSFHSKTGGENRLPPKYGVVMKIVNLFIFDNTFLIKNFRKIDFLSHTPYLENEKVKKSIIQNPPKKLWIENHHYGKKGVEETIDQIIDYRKKGINAYGMLDLYHLLAKIPYDQIEKNWNNIIFDLEKYTQWFSGIHFPIGSRKNDSLPIEKITDKMLCLFGKKIIPYIDRIVIENQQSSLGLFGLTKAMLKKQKQRNKAIFFRLKKAQIL